MLRCPFWALKCTGVEPSSAYVSGHFPFLGAVPFTGRAARYVTLLRHPVARVRSLYRHIGAAKGHPLHWIPKNHSLAEAVRLGLMAPQTAENPRGLPSMVSLLCGQRTAQDRDGSRVATAKHNLLANFDVVGVLEWMPQTIALLEACVGLVGLSRVLKTSTPGLQLGPVSEHNAGHGDAGESMPAPLWHAILGQYIDDLELYQFGLQLFALQLMTTPGIPNGLAAPFLRRKL